MKRPVTTLEIKNIRIDAGGHTYQELADMYGRSRYAIIKICQRYGISPFNAKKRWNEEDDDIVLMYYREESVEKIISRLSTYRSEYAVRSRFSYLLNIMYPDIK